ncbi:MAG: hypothetical protein ACL9RN_15920 [Cylindrospermopsis raciborskii]|uniref:hypothetical protein n=1 Tax=Cylindrospermopsis raciborskii TaxID=77022 RepID=UPI003D0EA5C4
MQVIEKNSLFAQVSGEQSAVVSGGAAGTITAEEAADNAIRYGLYSLALLGGIDPTTFILLGLGVLDFQ